MTTFWVWFQGGKPTSRKRDVEHPARGDMSGLQPSNPIGGGTWGYAPCWYIARRWRLAYPCSAPVRLRLGFGRSRGGSGGGFAEGGVAGEGALDGFGAFDEVAAAKAVKRGASGLHPTHRGEAAMDGAPGAGRYVGPSALGSYWRRNMGLRPMLVYCAPLALSLPLFRAGEVEVRFWAESGRERGALRKVVSRVRGRWTDLAPSMRSRRQRR